MTTLAKISELIEHEEIIPAHFEKLRKEILADGILKKQISVDMKTKIILDGHHRFNVIKSLGLKKIPVAIVDYMSSDIVVIPWNENKELTKDMVLECVTKGDRFPAKTTKHMVLLGGKLKHISEIEKIVNVSLDNLR